MSIFTDLSALIPEGGAVQIALLKKGEKLSLMLAPNFDDKDAKLMPLTMSGTAEELDANFIEAIRSFAPDVQEYSTNLDMAKSAAKAKTNAIKTNASKGKGKTENAQEEALKARKNGEINKEQVEILVSTPTSDVNFKTTLMSASCKTIQAALDDDRLEGKTAINKVATELAKVSGEEVVKILGVSLSAKYKSATDPAKRKKIENWIKDLIGQTLAELGLAPKQISLLNS